MDEVDFDRELHRALQVTPSPEFVARVRTKIAEAPRPSIWGGVLRPAAALTSIAVVAVAVGFWQGDPRLMPSSPAMQRSAADPKVNVTKAVSPTAPASTTTAAGKANAINTTRRTKPPTAVAGREQSIRVDGRDRAPIMVAEPPLPEVIIAPDNIKALHEFVTGALELRFVASFDITPKPIPWTVLETLDNRN